MHVTKKKVQLKSSTDVCHVAHELSALSMQEDKLSACYWKNCKAFVDAQKKLTQEQYYASMQSCSEVLQLARLNSKQFGSISDK